MGCQAEGKNTAAGPDIHKPSRGGGMAVEDLLGEQLGFGPGNERPCVGPETAAQKIHAPEQVL